MNGPDIHYDEQSDTLSILLGEASDTVSYEPVPGVIVTVDAQQRVVAIEFEGEVQQRFASLIEKSQKTPEKNGLLSFLNR
ncbi:MAG: DUF2283 domain-containing protein [Dehalococcoidia bacterium]